MSRCCPQGHAIGGFDERGYVSNTAKGKKAELAVVAGRGHLAPGPWLAEKWPDASFSSPSFSLFGPFSRKVCHQAAAAIRRVGAARLLLILFPTSLHWEERTAEAAAANALWEAAAFDWIKTPTTASASVRINLKLVDAEQKPPLGLTSA